MDFLPLLLAGLAAIGVAALIVLQLRAKAADPRLDALSGQLQQLAAQQSAAQAAAQTAID